MTYTMEQFDSKVSELMRPGVTGLSKLIEDSIKHANFEDVEKLYESYKTGSGVFGFHLIEMMLREAEEKASDHFQLDQEGDDE